MAVARTGASAALLPDGEVLIVGGTAAKYGEEREFLASAELFNPATDTFKPLGAKLNTARAFAATAVLPGGEVLIAGGVGSEGALKTSERYVPSEEKFIE